MPPVEVVAPWEEPVMVIDTAAAQATPPVPQAFTCTVWAPVPALTVAPMVELSTMVVAPLSSE